MKAAQDNLPETDVETEKIRSVLFFLSFIENKIINKQVYYIDSLEMCEIKGLSDLLTSQRVVE